MNVDEEVEEDVDACSPLANVLEKGGWGADAMPSSREDALLPPAPKRKRMVIQATPTSGGERQPQR